MKFLKTFLSVLLVVSILATPVYAAPKRVKYVSDVVIAYGDTKEDAIAWLRSAGYTEYLNADLNKNSESMYDDARAVVLGYKTTYNADEAITDLALMNMEGGYSYTSYTDMLAKKKLEIADFVTDFSVALQEYRQNYAAGNKRAVAAYQLLNEFIDDDTGKTFGDLLLNPLKEEMSQDEYNALSPEQRKDHGDFTTIFLQGNALAVMSIERIVSMAADTASDTWLDRLSKLGPDGLLDQYVDKGFSIKDALREITLDYSEQADILLTMWDDLQSLLTMYVNTRLTPDSSEEEIRNYFTKHVELDIGDWSYAASVYEGLKQMPYGEDETLLDLFTMPKEDLADEDYDQLCVIASVLSPGQTATLEFVPLAQMLNIGIVGNDAEAWTRAAKEALAVADSVSEDEGMGAGSAEPLSVYNGVDRSLYEGDIALTNDALRKEAKSNKGFYEGTVFGVNVVKLRNIIFAIGIGCAVAALIIKHYSIPMVLARPEKIVHIFDGYHLYIDQKYMTADKLRNVTKFFTIASVIMCAAGLIITVYDLIESYSTEYVPIPDRIVDEVPVEGTGETRYVYYKVAPCNRQYYYDHDPGTSLSDQEKIMAKLGNDNDMHADLGKVWLSLYYTKDKDAGKPITADFVVSKSNNVIGYKALHLFGQADAVNLSDSQWCYTDEMLKNIFSDKADSIFVFYGVSSGSPLTSSTFSTGIIALYIGGGLIVGACAGVAVTMAVTKSRKKENGTEA